MGVSWGFGQSEAIMWGFGLSEEIMVAKKARGWESVDAERKP